MRKAVLAFLLFLLGVPGPLLLAQGSVAGSLKGIVSDSQGAVVVGAEISVTSPALLKAKEQKSQEGGVYLIEDLPPGDYRITVTMPGFKTFQQSGITLTASFVATINVPLSIGEATDFVTVSGANDPVVDVTSATTPTTFDTTLLGNTPYGDDPWSLLAQTPGVTTSTFDVGGNNSYQQSSESVHGSKTTEQTYVFNGLVLEGTSGTSTDYYVDPYSFSEAQVVTDAAPAQYPTGGAYLNMITRQGSNQIHGFVLFNYEDDKTQRQLPPTVFTPLVAGAAPVSVLNAGSPFIRAYDSSADMGGPLIRDKWWIFGGYRAYQLKQQLRASPLPSPVTGAPPPTTNPGLYGFGTDVNHQENTTLRTDYQINSKNVANAIWHWQYINRFFRRLTYNYVDQVAAQRQIEPAYILQAQETFTPNSSWTFDTRGGFLQVIFPLRYESGVAGDTISAADSGLSTLKYAGQENYVDKEQTARISEIASYFKGGWHGAHNFKAGAEYQFGQRIQSYTYNQNILEIYSSSAIPDTTPNSVRIEPGPLRFNTSTHSNAVFLQDAWTLNRHLTLNLGVRFDHSDANVPQQCNPAMTGVFAGLFPNRCISQVQAAYASQVSTPGITRTQLGPLTNFASVDSYNNVVPRVSVAYDPTGKGDQVIRAGFNIFTNNVGSSLADSANPNGASYITYGWNGSFLNGGTAAGFCTPGAINSCTPDYTVFIPNCAAGVAQGTGGCLNLGKYSGVGKTGQGGYLSTSGGIAGYVDPNLKRPYSITYNVGYEKTVRRNIALGIAYYYRNNRNIQTTANINAPLTDYTPITLYPQTVGGVLSPQPILSPLTGKPITLYSLTGNSRTCAASANQTDVGCGWTETTNNPYANQNHYNGLEFTVSRRLIGRWSAQGGLTIQKDHGVQTTGDFNDPNVNLNRYGAIDQDAEFVVRLDATYRLPWRLQTSVNYQHETGFPIVPTNSFNLPLTTYNGATYGLAQGTELVNMAPNGALRYPAVNDTNLRFGRVTPIRERFTLETNCDLFNLFNSHAITTETATEAQANGVNSTTFTRPSNFLGPFIARFSAKLSF